mmetsp:Transcript_33310/g.70076  ORF Transcript_33310/g.70076 Transcript_33310/m.70076 type:complete len:112 (-) Transcript_33310:2-337(-)
MEPAAAAPIPRPNNDPSSSDAPGAEITLFSMFTVADVAGKGDGVPGDERKATSPSLPSGVGRRDFVSDPDESTSVVGAADVEVTADRRRRPRRRERVGRSIMVQVYLVKKC